MDYKPKTMLHRFRLILLCFFLIPLHAIHAQTYVPGGVISEADWTSADSPYIVQGNITVAGKLSVGPGVEVKVDGYYRITVNGHVQIEGTELQPVSFSAVDTTGWSSDINTDGGWRGLYAEVNYNLDSSYVKHCIIKDTKSNNMNTGDPTAEAALIIERDMLLAHCEIFHNKHNNPNGVGENTVISLGTALPTQNITIQNCTIRDNIGMRSIIVYKGFVAGTFEMKDSRLSNNYGGVTCLLLDSETTIEDNEFDNNEIIHNWSAVILVDQGESLIRGNKIHHNKTFKSAAITCWASSATIEKNLVSNNNMTYGSCGWTDGGGGIHLQGVGNAPYILRDNIIANNHTAFYGGGIYIHSSEVHAYNNTIVNNSSDEYQGAAVSIFGNSAVVNLNNNILSGNENNFGATQQINMGGAGNLSFNYNYIDTPFEDAVSLSGTLVGETSSCIIDTNLDLVDPTFSSGIEEDATDKNFDLLATSSCIDAGDNSLTSPGLTDYDYDPRITGARIDIGAHEFNGVTMGLDELSRTNQTVYPNPFVDRFTISSTSNQARVWIFDASGKRIDSFGGNRSPDLSHLRSGIYLLRVFSDTGVRSIKVLKN